MARTRMLGGTLTARTSYRRGLSLIELIVVMSILLILALFYIPSLVGDQDKVSDREATANLGIAYQVAEGTYSARGGYSAAVVLDAVGRRERDYLLTTTGSPNSLNPSQILAQVDPLQGDQVITLCNQGKTGRYFCLRADEKGLLQAVGNNASRSLARSNGTTLTEAQCWLPRRNGGPLDCTAGKGGPSWLPGDSGQSDKSTTTAAPTLSVPTFEPATGNDVLARWTTTGQVSTAECRLDSGSWIACGALTNNTFTVPTGDHTVSIRVTGPGGTATRTVSYSRTATSSYKSLILADNPRGYWRLGEATGTNVANEVSGSPALTYLNTPLLGRPSLIAADTNTSAVFNGADNRAYTSTPVPGMSLANNFSVEAWVRIPRLPAQGPFVKIGRAGEGGAEGTAYDGVGLGVGNGGYDAAGSGLHAGFDGYCFSSPGWNFPSTGVYHVVFTRDEWLREFNRRF